MISVKQRTLHEAIYDGSREARNQGRPLLISYIEKIEYIHPITYFNNSGVAFNGQRFFWSSPDHHILVGAGFAATFEGQGPERTQEIKAQWERVLTHWAGSREEAGTGPVLVGGLSFDPANPHVSRWSGFPEAGFSIPTFLLTQKKDNTWLTVNTWVEGTTDTDQLSAELIARKNDLLKEQPVDFYATSWIKQVNDLNTDAWKSSVKTATTKIANRELEKVVLAREVEIQGNTHFSLPSILKSLADNQQMSYIFAFERGDKCFIGATPERLIERRGTTLYTGALAGTAARGRSQAEDRRLENDLLRDTKNRGEHDFVVKMICEAMANFTEELTFPDRPEVLKVKDVQHLYTPISGRAKRQVSLLDIVEKLHPTPALGGQPREKALELIQQLEDFNRGWYASPIGWLDAEGYGEFAVAIRSALIKDDRAWAYAGCGVVEASDPDEELEETHLKLRPMLAALGGGRNLDN
ncbi:MAG TPA: isochorismate synthase [Candidatus Angelobacter sp.]|nr:isochorismate synthase [Candidatus Angelobacter sp.]